MAGPNEMSQWFVSPFNFNASESEYQKVIIRDVTLREANDTPQVDLTLSDKIELGYQLIDAGISEIDVGFPAVDKEIQKLIAEFDNKQIFAGFVRGWVDDLKIEIDSCMQMGIGNLYILFPGSKFYLSHRPQFKSLEEIPPKIYSAIEYSRKQGAKAGPLIMDATRSDLWFLMEVCQASSNATQLMIADSKGVTSPIGMRRLIARINQKLNIPIFLHIHNDFGFAMASTFAALEAGAKGVDASILGLGDRAGVTPMEELVVALHCLSNFDSGVDIKKMNNLVDLVAEKSNIKPHSLKPLFGENAFIITHDFHALSAVKGVWGASHPIDPEVIGTTSRLAVFDEEIVIERAKFLGFESIKLDQINKMLQKSLDIFKKSGPLTLREFDHLIKFALEK